ncbi:hypothetical protein H1W37_18240 [Stappia taiwanensis]|uniref:Uncharacterized protein n=1 Tax=Stappia taiwanensis TaxID=992267 RepID=A0A838XX16_9HYPH|nr:hypothetical protein [Stappia taiwanensis]MBA4613601.1 hypothetical protein [Stappia taiwanensis]
MPLITRRSSTRALPRVLAGNNGRNLKNGSSLSQKYPSDRQQTPVQELESEIK